jgi:uncharacterized protein (DUF2235 family)
MKRLVVCCDGTWQNLISSYPTNVVKLAQAVKVTSSDDVPQLVFYDEGVGTEDKADKLTGKAFGWGLDKNIQDAYRFLCLNYSQGDEIYLFGFSRGAYTVRSLAGLIYCSGLLSRSKIRRMPQAYMLYRDPELNPDDQEAIDFRQRNGEHPPITLLGCWDTVGSLGVPNLFSFLPIDKWIGEKYKFHDTSLSPIIQNALRSPSMSCERFLTSHSCKKASILMTKLYTRFGFREIMVALVAALKRKEGYPMELCNG